MSKPIGEYFRETRSVGKLPKDYAKAVSPISTDSSIIIPEPSEPQGITGERLPMKHVIRGKGERVRSEHPICRDKYGRDIIQKPREQTWLKIEKLPRYAYDENGIIHNPPFSEMVESDSIPETVANRIRRETLVATKALIGRIRKGEFQTAEEFEFSSEYIELQRIALQANICLKCRRAKRVSGLDYKGIAGEPYHNFVGKCRPMFLPVVINGQISYRLWLGVNKLAERVKKTDSRGKPLEMFDIKLDSKPVGVPEMVRTSLKCVC